MIRDHVHNFYCAANNGSRKRKPTRFWTEVIPKPRWMIINEARRDIEDLYLPKRFIKQSSNSLDFAKL